MLIESGVLSGEVAVITGGARGLGRAIAAAFARAGAAVALVARSANELASTAREIEDAGGMVVTHCADVTDEAAMTNAIEEVRASLGPITILVNNAGTIGPIGPFGSSAPGDWWRCVEVNLRGSALCTHLVISEMVARGRGRIINVVSGAGIFSSTYYSAYSASKTAVVRWTECIAAELRPYGVQVLAMEPGTVATAMSTFSLTAPEGRRWIPWFKDIFDLGLNSTAELVAQRAVDLATGKGDALSGRYVPLTESLDERVASATRIRDEALYSLRISRLAPLPASVPNAALRATRMRSEMPSLNVVRLSRRLPISAHEAFDLWRDGETVSSWFFPPGLAEWIGRRTMEPIAGGRFDFRVSAGGVEFHIHGTVTGATPGACLALQWNWESDSPIVASATDTNVSVQFVPVRGGVEVVIVHDNLPNETVRDAYIRGWRRCLDEMVRLAG